MYLLGLLSCVLILSLSGNTAADDDESLELSWPVKYTMQVEKISLTGGLVEDIQYWRTKTKSRIDFNKGAVKKMSVKPRLKGTYRLGVKYEVHPETTAEDENYIVCKRTQGTVDSIIYLDDILPTVNSFEHVGSEKVDEDTVEKFVFTEVSNSESKETIWAIYNKNNKTWAPIRYEKIKFDLWLGSKLEHEIWNIINFNIDFDSDAVFNFEEKYDCEDAEASASDVETPTSVEFSADNEQHVDHVFDSFKERYNKVYANEKEHSMRRTIFQNRMRLVLEHNSKNKGYKLTINKFADRTPEEIKKYKGLIRTGQREPSTIQFPYTESEVKELASKLPAEFDLRDLGIITPVKDQSDCGSCWSFGTTSAVEGALARKNGGRLIRLSNQALIDCAWGYGPQGCGGGFDIGAYRWMMDHGLPTEEEYGAYANKEGFCHYNNMTEVYPIRGFTNVTPFSVQALKLAIVNHGPLSISVNALESMLMYQGGIYYEVDCDANKLDHEVTLVGYGMRDGEEYWIVKNSWGQNWGVDGYIHISTRDNNCGVTTEPSYPVL